MHDESYIEHGDTMPTIMDEMPGDAVVEQDHGQEQAGSTNPEDWDVPDNSDILNRLEADLRQLDAQVREIAGLQPSAQQGPRDYNAELARIAEAVDDGDISLSEAIQRQSEILERVQAESADRIRQEVYTQKEADKILNDFHKAHPDFQQFAASKDMQRIMASSPMHDEFSSYWAWKAEGSAGSTRTGNKSGTKAPGKGIETRGMDIKAVIANRLANTRRAGQ